MQRQDAIRSPLIAAGEFPRVFRDYRGFHAGETVLVCGCGSSLSQVIAPERVVTIGVNDVGRLFDPDYLLVVNPRTQFTADRFTHVERSRAHAIFTQLNLQLNHPCVIRFQMGTRGGTTFENPDVLHHTRNSPYPAICLAVHMGARRIGVIGVDFTQHHFFAQTGRHALTAEIDRINQEYRQLDESCRRRNVDIFNLSAESLLTAFRKMRQDDFLRGADPPSGFSGRKIFFVNYRFLSCGHVFRDGLDHAAAHLGLESKAALWDKPDLHEEISAFRPDLLFAVHGRKFSTRIRSGVATPDSAVWLLDEPYEVDDTSRFSSLFGTQFVNDPATLHRHANARYLPVCYDPDVHTYLSSAQRPHAVGFIGGANPMREQALTRLARRDLLTYIVGGPWRDPALLRLNRSTNIPAGQTADLYRNTRIVVNIFRTVHHYNSSGIAPVSMNPRIFEALQCGALVISEHRPEMDSLCPELPVFRSMDEMEDLVERFLAQPDHFARVRKACIRRLAGHSYAQRLRTVLEATLERQRPAAYSLPHPAMQEKKERIPIAARQNMNRDVLMAETADERRSSLELPPEMANDWEVNGSVVQLDSDGSLRLWKTTDDGPGTEQGLIDKIRHEEVILEFDVLLARESRFIAKIHQAEAHNQLSNSYHLVCSGGRAYLARHNRVLSKFFLPLDSWTPISFSYSNGSLLVRKSGTEVARVTDRTLAGGYCFLGVKGGSVSLRNVRVKEPRSAEARRSGFPHQVFQAASERARPKVSIITTVYDRIECLEQCVRSVAALEFRDFEHIVVADAPPRSVLEQIRGLVAEHPSETAPPIFANLKLRGNDWGISPAALGLRMAIGQYVCFLSDDNGYKPHHFKKLVNALDTNPHLGFVYSSCLYDGRTTLNASIPRAGRIDLGQPLFRRELFEKYLGGTLPFHEFGWDWRMIERFICSGVQWRHLNEDTFIFRLAKYPHLAGRPLELRS